MYMYSHTPAPSSRVTGNSEDRRGEGVSRDVGNFQVKTLLWGGMEIGSKHSLEYASYSLVLYMNYTVCVSTLSSCHKTNKKVLSTK